MAQAVLQMCIESCMQLQLQLHNVHTLWMMCMLQPHLQAPACAAGYVKHDGKAASSAQHKARLPPARDLKHGYCHTKNPNYAAYLLIRNKHCVWRQLRPHVGSTTTAAAAPRPAHNHEALSPHRWAAATETNE
jgi:hypothetical protein